MEEEEGTFDFQQHSHTAVAAYLERRDFYEDLAAVVSRIVEEALKRRNIKVHSIQTRAKEPTSFGRKAALPSEQDPTSPKYSRPLEQITDLAGVRVITFFPNTLIEIDRVVEEEFEIVEKSNKGADLIAEERFGYQSIHYLVRLKSQRASLPEYRPFAESTTEIQVRTILQHAWAEIEHDIQYKSSAVIPTEIRRRFMALAGMLEIADREFQAIQDDDKQLTTQARERVQEGELEQVEITPDALKAFLDKKLGPDNRISEFSYNWTARLLKRMGFRTLRQVEQCIQGYDDDQLSRLISGSRQGQTSRFEYMIMAGMGRNYFQRHPFAASPWWSDSEQQKLGAIERGGIQIQDYDPGADVPKERLPHDEGKA